MLLPADAARPSGDEGHSSVAPKLLHDMHSQSLTGMRLLQHLQVGCLMGCLTHLSLAGESDVKDDPNWSSGALLASQYTALFLANPYLQYIDLSYTGLTNNGIFYLLLELSYCDPLPSHCGLKCLKQLVLGPPFKRSGTASCREPFMKTAISPLQEVYLQCPALELTCLVHPRAPALSDTEEAYSICHRLWMSLDDDHRVANSHYQGMQCSVLRTRNGTNALVHTHKHKAKFSEQLLPGTWIARYMKEAQEEMGALDDTPEDHRPGQEQCQRTIPSSWNDDSIEDFELNGAPVDQHNAQRYPDLPLYRAGDEDRSHGDGHQLQLSFEPEYRRAGHAQQHGGQPSTARGASNRQGDRALHNRNGNSIGNSHPRRPQQGSRHRDPSRSFQAVTRPNNTHTNTNGPHGQQPTRSDPRFPPRGPLKGASVSRPRVHVERPMPLQPQHRRVLNAGAPRPQGKPRHRPRSEAAEAREMYKQLWGAQRSPDRAPRARKNAGNAPVRRRAHTGSRPRAQGAAHATYAAAGGDEYRGQGGVIDLSDDGSLSDRSPVVSPHTSPQHRVTDLTSPDFPPRPERSGSMSMSLSPAGSHGYRADLDDQEDFYAIDDGADMAAFDDVPVSPASQRSNEEEHARKGKGAWRGKGLWGRSLSPFSAHRHSLSPGARPGTSGDMPYHDQLMSPLSPLERNNHRPGSKQQLQRRLPLNGLQAGSDSELGQDLGTLGPNSARNLPQHREASHSAGHFDGHAATPRQRASTHARPPPNKRMSKPTKNSGSIPRPRKSGQHPPKPHASRNSANRTSDTCDAPGARGSAVFPREHLYQDDDAMSASDISCAPEDDGDDSQDEAAVRGARIATEYGSASPEHAPRQHAMTGAQRRRMKRLQEDQQLAEKDPEAWAHLQQTRAALMPYGWDKRKELHPIGAALDPTAFEQDAPVATAAAPGAGHEPPGQPDAPHAHSSAAAAPAAGPSAFRAAQGDVSISDDDFDPGAFRPPAHRTSHEPPLQAAKQSSPEHPHAVLDLSHQLPPHQLLPGPPQDAGPAAPAIFEPSVAFTAPVGVEAASRAADGSAAATEAASGGIVQDIQDIQAPDDTSGKQAEACGGPVQAVDRDGEPQTDANDVSGRSDPEAYVLPREVDDQKAQGDIDVNMTPDERVASEPATVKAHLTGSPGKAEESPVSKSGSEQACGDVDMKRVPDAALSSAGAASRSPTCAGGSINMLQLLESERVLGTPVTSRGTTPHPTQPSVDIVHAETADWLRQDVDSQLDVRIDETLCEDDVMHVHNATLQEDLGLLGAETLEKEPEINNPNALDSVVDRVEGVQNPDDQSGAHAPLPLPPTETGTENDQVKDDHKADQLIAKDEEPQVGQDACLPAASGMIGVETDRRVRRPISIGSLLGKGPLRPSGKGEEQKGSGSVVVASGSNAPVPSATELEVRGTAGHGGPAEAGGAAGHVPNVRGAKIKTSEGELRVGWRTADDSAAAAVHGDQTGARDPADRALDEAAGTVSADVQHEHEQQAAEATGHPSEDHGIKVQQLPQDSRACTSTEQRLHDGQEKPATSPYSIPQDPRFSAADKLPGGNSNQDAKAAVQTDVAGDAPPQEVPAAAKKPATKSRAQKELESLTLFHWDKFAQQNPVGKQLVGVAEQEGGRARRRPKKRSYLENPALLGRTSSGQREHRPSREAADSRVLQPKGPAAAVNTPVPADTVQQSTVTADAAIVVHKNDEHHATALGSEKAGQAPGKKSAAAGHTSDKTAADVVVKKRKSRLLSSLVDD